MKVGFIGTGTMGSLLIESFIKSGSMQPEHITVSNRTPAKAQALVERFPGIHIKYTNADAALHNDIVFLCIKPLEFVHVIENIKSVIKPNQIIVSITSPVLIKHLEHELNCKIAKVIPSITNLVLSGASLCMYGQTMEEADKDRLEALFSQISQPLRIEENYTRIVSDLSSCGPAFFSFLLEQFIEAAVEETGIQREDATRVASNMLLGTGMLLTEGKLTPAEVQDKVSVPGGITAEALTLLRNKLDGVFNQLVHTTHAKYKEDLHKVSNALCGKEVNGQ